MSALPRMAALGWTEAQADLLDVATGFCRDRSPPERVRALMTDLLGHDPAVLREMAGLGWFGAALPEASGGSGLAFGDLVPVVERMGRAALSGPFVDTITAARAIATHGPDAWRADVLPAVAAGATVAIAFTAAPGDAPRARIAGDRAAMAGRALLVETGPHADHVLVALDLEGERAFALLARADVRADAWRAERIVDETRRAYALDLSDAGVRADALIRGEAARGFDRALRLAGALMTAADACGGAAAALDLTLDYVRARRQFGRPIGAYQAIKHPLVDLYVALEQARSHLYAAAAAFEAGDATAEIAVRMAKAATDDVFAEIADRGIQFHGGMGFTWDCDAGLWRRRALWSGARWGDSAHHRRALADLLFGPTETT